jgi:hypothetical protein
MPAPRCSTYFRPSIIPNCWPPTLVGDCTIATVWTITLLREDDTNVMFPDDGVVRIEVLQRLAELAMTDAAFRAVARDDLPGALEKYGYQLTASELALVLRFRRSLAEAGVDLDLVDGIGDDRLTEVLESLQRRARENGLLP